MPEPWLRSTLLDVPAVPRAVLHALELAEEDIEHWAAQLTDAEVSTKPLGLTPFAFHVRHIVHSLDRLLTYAEGAPLSVVQRAALNVELEPVTRKESMLAEFRLGLEDARARILKFPLNHFEATRHVGTQRLPASLGGLLVHLADHTQRHSGQAVVTAKLLLALRRS
jgi:hypothetical protein